MSTALAAVSAQGEAYSRLIAAAEEMARACALPWSEFAEAARHTAGRALREAAEEYARHSLRLEEVAREVETTATLLRERKPKDIGNDLAASVLLIQCRKLRPAPF